MTIYFYWLVQNCHASKDYSHRMTTPARCVCVSILSHPSLASRLRSKLILVAEKNVLASAMVPFSPCPRNLPHYLAEICSISLESFKYKTRRGNLPKMLGN